MSRFLKRGRRFLSFLLFLSCILSIRTQFQFRFSTTSTLKPPRQARVKAHPQPHHQHHLNSLVQKNSLPSHRTSSSGNFCLRPQTAGGCGSVCASGWRAAAAVSTVSPAPWLLQGTITADPRFVLKGPERSSRRRTTVPHCVSLGLDVWRWEEVWKDLVGSWLVYLCHSINIFNIPREPN